MTHQLWITLLFNIVINSTLTFATICLLVKIVLFFLRIRDERLRAYAYCLPILKLPYDLFQYRFDQWALAQGLNPLECAEGTRLFSVAFPYSFDIFSLFYGLSAGFYLDSGQSFTVADCLVLSLSHQTQSLYLACFMIFVLAMLSMHLTSLLKGYCQMQQIKQTYVPCPLTIKNPLLKQRLKKQKAHIYLSDKANAPFAYRFLTSFICLPSSLIPTLTQQEYEAIIAHELEHLRWGDSFLQLSIWMIRFVFCWIPASRLIKKIEEAKEKACDECYCLYSLDPIDMATAIKKAADYEFGLLIPLQTAFVSQSTALKRIKALVLPKVQPNWTVLSVSRFALIVLSLCFLAGRFWIF